jgi:hypothetical protein
LWNLGNSSGEFIDIWGDNGSKVVENWVVKEFKRDEELLPGESPSNLNYHSNESHSELFSIFVRDTDISNSFMELWKIMVVNKSSGICWDKDRTEFGDNKLGNEPWEHKGGTSSDQSSKGNEINVREVSVIHKFCPLWNFFL